MLTNFWKDILKKRPTARSKPGNYCLPNCGATPLCNLRVNNDSADCPARLGLNQEKEQTPTTEMNSFLSKMFFDKKLQRNVSEDMAVPYFKN